MTTREQECQHLRTKIVDHETNITQMEDLLQRTPSDGLKAALQSERIQRDAARNRLHRLEDIIALEADIDVSNSTIAQHERNVQILREEQQALQRRLTAAETELNKARIDLSSKQDDLRQKLAELDHAAPTGGAPPRPDVQALAGSTVRLSQAPTAVLRLSNGKVEQLPGNDVVIGREKTGGVDIALNEETVSSAHARIVYDSSKNQWTLTDLGSSNGTWADNTQLQPNQTVTIQHGSVLHFGRVSAAFDLSGVTE